MTHETNCPEYMATLILKRQGTRHGNSDPKKTSQSSQFAPALPWLGQLKLFCLLWNNGPKGKSDTIKVAVILKATVILNVSCVSTHVTKPKKARCSASQAVRPHRVVSAWTAARIAIPVQLMPPTLCPLPTPTATKVFPPRFCTWVHLA